MAQLPKKGTRDDIWELRYKIHMEAESKRGQLAQLMDRKAVLDEKMASLQKQIDEVRNAIHWRGERIAGLNGYLHQMDLTGAEYYELYVAENGWTQCIRFFGSNLVRNEPEG